MEDQKQPACKPLPIESFSCSWLVNFPSLENIGNSTRTSVDTYDDSCSYIEMDPRLPPSRRFFVSPKDRSFKFDNFSNSESLAHADELFCDGYVMPLSTNSAEESQPLDSPSERPETMMRTVRLTKSKSSSCSRRFRSVSKCVLLKYIDFLTPLCRRIRNCKASRPNGSNGTKDGYDSRIRVTRNRVYSDETTTASPRMSVAEDWRRSCDSESSIYEAVLHCKKSFGK
ncbi:PREDICTED: probable membrane-associated kinase regulator 6 isoform X2 [Tarenaya hassleriana]|uniref:probable membrane-associated kinase regulator 6 isoform X2 n=1 Tax=Tarenaya hassleriana TaxID=28532 RepID=UPI00053C592B|nr:PREDICTED: probable membrane-associated kinase regulator 6 isoform X2 [Tarenaya hassleriana]